MKKLLLILSSFFFSYSVSSQSWVSQATGFSDASRGISEIKIIDANIVWALAYDGVAGAVIQEFTKTTNGGATWTPGTINVGDPALEINNLCPVNATTAWVSALIPADGNGVIYKTSDGGATWVQQNASGFQSSGQSFINGVHFFNANIGVAFGDPVNGEFEIYRTTDGGTTWSAVPAASLPNPTSGEYGYNGGNFSLGTNLWLPTNKGRLLRTTDMGVTWSVSQAPLTDFGGASQSGRVSFSSATNGCLLKTAGTTYTFYTTTNGGATWSAGTPFTGAYRLLTYIPDTNIIVATSQATGASGSAYSTDNGTTWTTIDSGAQRGVSAFLNGSTGWCAGFSSDPFTDGIFKISGNLATNDFSLNTNFSIYPNPSNSVVSISSAAIDSYKLTVADLTGKVLVEKSLSGIENSLDISSFSKGIYFFTLNSDKKSETIKVIKN